MYGSFGAGKTFHANCVANALIDKGFRVKATQFEELYRLEQVTKNKADFFTTLSRYALVVLDDLGAEKNNSSMRSFVFTVIDTLYKSKTPFIITTNLSIEEIKSPSESENRRIYERILERCPCPISVERPEGSIRLQRVRETHADYKRMLGLE